MAVYYNEFDPYCAQWLRNLIGAGHIAPGDVDERSIEDVRPDDLHGYDQCHFFAGIGIWSLALRSAGWDDTRRVWTASCPCQPFSAAGKGAGFADERHLWPAFYHLVSECRPECILGEQVTSKDAEAWIDLVHADMEALGYAFGCVPFPSAGVGAPHLRDRAYWVANNNNKGLEGRRILSKRAVECIAWPSGVASSVADSGKGKRGRRPDDDALLCDGQEAARYWSPIESDGTTRESNGTGPINGYWRNADWIGCSDGRWRPIEPGTFPLADECSNRMGKLRAYGNAINAEAAKAFIECAMGK